MLQRLLHLVPCLLLPLFYATLSAQPNPVFSAITEEDGLTNGFVTDIVQSTNGYYYFATTKGLNRYDGYGITSWIFPTGDSTNAPTNPVLWCLTEAADSMLYIGTQRGFSAFDPRAGRFQHFFYNPADSNSLSNNGVWEVYTDSLSEAVWVGTDNGLCRYLPEKKMFQRFFYAYKPADRQPVYAFLRTGDGNLWAGVGPHLTRIDPASDRCPSFTIPGFHKQEQENYTIRALLQDRNGILWVGTGNQGLYAFDPKRGLFIRHLTQAEGLRNLRIRALHEDKKGNIWVGTYGGGLHFLPPDRSRVTPYETDKFNPAHENFEVVFHIEEDRQGNMLLGTFYGGVKLHLAHKKPFRHYLPVAGKPGTLPRANFGAYYPHTDGTIWLPARGDSFYIFDPHTERFSTQKIQLAAQRPDQPPEIRSFIADEAGNIWGMGKRSMVVRTAGQNNWEYFLPEGSPPNAWFTVQFIDRQQRHWIGTQTGLYLFAAASRSLSPISLPHTNDYALTGNNQYVQSLEQTSDHSLWVATEGGINRIGPGTDSITYFPFPEAVFDVEQDSRGRIWVGTIKGLARYHAETGKIMLVEAAKASQQGVVWGLMEDAKGRMWFTSNQTLHYFDPATEVFRTFSQAQGLKNRQYFGHHLCLGASDFFFGGTQGMLRFDPLAIQENPYPPQVVITGVELFNQPLPVRGTLADSMDTPSPLLQAPAFAKKLKLNHRQQDLTFTFAGLDITAPENNQYRYRLRGYDKKWIVASAKQRRATYTNLSPGTYTFEVMASNNDEVWAQEPAVLGIYISPPWYWNPLAWLIYLGAIFSLLKILYDRQVTIHLARQQRALAMESAQEKARHLQELHATRTRVFTNLSHEFRTPLTNILGVTELWSKHPGQWQRKAPERIKRSAQELLRLVEQMLGIARLDTNTLSVNWQHGDVIGYLAYLLEAFTYMADQKNITLEFRSPVDEFYMDFDPDKWQAIFGNLLSNALKFTPEDGRIILLVDQAGADVFQFKVIDNGPGIAAADLPYIFDRFYQANDTAHQGTGIGLAYAKELIQLFSGQISVQSTPGEGTVFTVALPVLRDAQSSFSLPATDMAGLSPKTSGSSGAAAVSSPDQPTLLIVEDHVEVLDYLRHVLTASYQVYTARDGLEGQRQAIELVPDLIISDLMMPRMDGLELCRHLKSDQRTNHIPIVLLTAKADIKSRLTGLQTGADAYLAKPVTSQELHVILRNLLHNRERLKQVYRNLNTNMLTGFVTQDLNEAFLHKAQQTIYDNLEQEDFDVAAFCRSMAISRTQLHNKLKAITGLSTTQFIRKTRIDYACHLLQKPETSISEVAFAVGFKHLSTFNRAFREWTGQTPGAYRDHRN